MFDQQLWNEIYGFALSRTRNPADAQDIAQETFLRAWTRQHQLRDPQKARSWLMSIAYRLILDRRRGDLLRPAPHGDDPVQEAMRREDISRVRTALSRLRPLDRTVLEAHYLDGERIRDIAARLGAPVGTVKRRLFDARRRFGEMYAKA